MADSQKTEQPTQRRIHKAREEGQFPAARHFVSAMQFVLFAALLRMSGGDWFADFRQHTREVFARAFAGDIGISDLISLYASFGRRAFIPLLSAGAGLMLCTVGLQLAATRFGVSLKKVAPDVKRLSPLAKLRDLPRQNIPALVQALCLLPVFGATLYYIIRDNLPALLALPMESTAAGARWVMTAVQQLLWKASLVFVVFGVVDLFRQRVRYRRDLRMSKQEIRDEVKELEGNPQVKMRIRRIRRDLLRRRMMQEVPKATALIVNPTHFAVALRYEMQSMTAPVVVAKGKNYLALRIRRKALEHQVPLVENPPLAQALYKSVEVGQEIPAHFYRAVAEILAYIYRLMQGRVPA